MANYSNLKAAIAAAIKQNGNQEITGQVLQNVLTSMVSVIGANYTFAGVATPSTNPGTPDQNVVYMASQAGMYTNFGGIQLPAGISLLMWNGSWTSKTVMCGDGGVFDISVYKSSGGTLATFADISAALDGGNNIPASARKGGMSVKFVQSSDNKYVQYRYIGTDVTTAATFTNTDNWQGVDAEPKPSSVNLVESGGVFHKIFKRDLILNETTHHSLWTSGQSVYQDGKLIALNAYLSEGYEGYKIRIVQCGWAETLKKFFFGFFLYKNSSYTNRQGLQIAYTSIPLSNIHYQKDIVVDNKTVGFIDFIYDWEAINGDTSNHLLNLVPDNFNQQSIEVSGILNERNATIGDVEDSVGSLTLDDSTAQASEEVEMEISLKHNEETVGSVIIGQATQQRAGLLPAINQWDTLPVQDSKKIISSGGVYDVLDSIIYNFVKSKSLCTSGASVYQNNKLLNIKAYLSDDYKGYTIRIIQLGWLESNKKFYFGALLYKNGVYSNLQGLQIAYSSIPLSNIRYEKEIIVNNKNVGFISFTYDWETINGDTSNHLLNLTSAYYDQQSIEVYNIANICIATKPELETVDRKIDSYAKSLWTSGQSVYQADKMLNVKCVLNPEYYGYTIRIIQLGWVENTKTFYFDAKLYKNGVYTSLRRSPGARSYSSIPMNNEEYLYELSINGIDNIGYISFLYDWETINGDTSNHLLNLTSSYYNQQSIEVTSIKFENRPATSNKVVVISKSGGDYNSFLEGMLYATSYMDSVVYVNDGVYDLYDEFIAKYGNDIFTNWVYDDWQTYCIFLKNRVKVYFSSGAKLQFLYDGANRLCAQSFTPLMAGEKGFELHNVTIHSRNCRYSVHDERAGSTDAYRNVYDGCEFTHEWTMQDPYFAYTQCIGGGLGKFGDITIDNCHFHNDVSWHNNGAAGSKSKIRLTNSYFDDGKTFRLSWYGQSTEITEALVSGNSLGATLIERAENESQTIVNTHIIEWNNIVRSV